MAKTQSRTEKFKEYREEIKKETTNTKTSSIEIGTSTIFSVPTEVKKEKKKKPKKDVNNKHAYEAKKEKKPYVVKEKTIYDEYVKAKMLKRFAYFLFVAVIIGLLVTVLILSLKNF